MAYDTTGWQRSLTLDIEILVDGAVMATHTYNGMNAFVYNGAQFAPITIDQMKQMPIADFIYRANAFMGYVQTLHPEFNPSSVNPSYGYYRYNDTACPANITPVPPPTTTTTTTPAVASTWQADYVFHACELESDEIIITSFQADYGNHKCELIDVV